MERKELRKLTLTIDTLTVAFSIIGIAIINTTYKNLGLQGYRFETVSLSVYSTIIGITLALIIFTTILYYTRKTLEIMGENEKTTTILFMKLIEYITLLLLVILTGLIYFAQTKESLSKIEIAGFPLYPYSNMLYLTSITTAGTGIYLYLFYQSQTKQLETTNKYIILAIYITLLAIHIPPNNNYGLAAQKITPDIRPITDGLTALFIITTLILYIKKLANKLKTTTENLAKGRLKTLILGNLFLLLTILFEALDILSGTPYTAWLTLSTITLIITVTLYYIGTLMPTWATKHFTK